MAANVVECAIYSPEYGDRIRILLEYAGAWRPILWMELAKDGSVYLGPRKVEITELLQGVAHPIDEQQVRVSYSDGTKITDPDALKKAKLSFHASGIVNTPTGRATRGPLRSLVEQELLCIGVFQHPAQFAAIALGAIRKRDVCLRYPVDENCPLWACLYIAPRHKALLATPATADHQLALMFEYPAVAGAPEFTLQLVLCHGPRGPWPPYTCLVFGGTVAKAFGSN